VSPLFVVGSQTERIRFLFALQKKLSDDEKKMKAEIKKMAKAGQHSAAKMIARDIVRIRTQGEKMVQFIGQLKALSLRIGSLASLNELSTAMEEASKAMMTVSDRIDTKKLNEMAKIMAKEDAKLDMKSDMMSDILDGIGESMDNPEEQEKVYKDVLKEVGLEMDNLIPDAGTKVVPIQQKQEVKAKEEDSLDAMLKELQK